MFSLTIFQSLLDIILARLKMSILLRDKVVLGLLYITNVITEQIMDFSQIHL